ncbi:glycosyltransferase 61 family protein [Aliiglaciecola lipolytica]|uniref:glycosyltransferase 61 family protein n=1 Tax=Aliiglaciecola lipolytica TaxID=477689 RepID=UPI001C085F4F|nr:glycosyltransferase family 61 protein [Aliiglaciecola lipolytica]MBU2877779.1 glycosyltransferase family 61 protein [Aliiglaciecola lipolytica]
MSKEKVLPTDIAPSARFCVLENAQVIPMSPGSSPGKVNGGILHPNKPDFAGQFRGKTVFQNSQELDLATNDVFLAKCDVKSRKNNGKYLYLGPVFNNFGHFLAECTHRAWGYEYVTQGLGEPIKQVIVLPQTPAKFPWLRQFKFKLPSIFLQTLDYLGIPERKIKYLFSPSTYEKIVVPEQASFFRSQKSVGSAYLQFLNRCERRNNILGTRTQFEKVYVSRIHFKFRGAYAAESYIENYFASQGYQIFYPQDHSLLEQLEIYKSAKEIIFAEGGGLHILELLSELKAKIYVLGRRPMCDAVFTSILRPRVKSFKFFTQVTTLPSLFIPKKSNRAAHGSAISMLDPQSLVEFLTAQIGLDTSSFCLNDFIQIAKQDIELYRTHYQSLQTENQQVKLNAMASFDKQLKKLLVE